MRSGASMGQDVMEPVSHGGDLDVARREFPSAPEPWIDLSTGINPHPYPLPQLSPELWQRLPERARMTRLAVPFRHCRRAAGAPDRRSARAVGGVGPGDRHR